MALEWRLRKHADYQKTYGRSRKGSTRQMTYFFARRDAVPEPVGKPIPNEADVRAGSGGAGPRVGLTVPKAVGKAHERNRIKRRMREIVRAEVGRLRGGVDVILHPRRSTMDAEFSVLRREVVEIFGRIERALVADAAGEDAGGPGASGGRLSARPKREGVRRR